MTTDEFARDDTGDTDAGPVPLASIRSMYRSKDPDYFCGSRSDMLELLPSTADGRILEIGCGRGNTGAAALARGLCAEYCAIELHETSALIARSRITEVVVGDVETTELPWAERSFDALILSEVLEHLVDPWSTLARIRPLLKPGAIALASTPNVSHYSVILMLMRGRWDLAESGTMDRAHLRWFTPRSLRELFESSRFVVDAVEPVAQPGIKSRWASRLMLGMGKHLLARQLNLRAHCDATS